jgi:chaperonin GroEL
MEEGIVPGGGIALFNVSMMLNDDEKKISAGAMRILMRALESPIRAIAANSGESPDRVVGDLQLRKSEPWRGFNAMTNKMSDLKEAGIIDPLKVTRAAFTNALSVAANYLTVGAAMTNLPEKKGPPGPPMGGMGGEDY